MLVLTKDLEWNEKSRFFRCILHLSAKNKAEIPLYNASAIQGMVYNTVENAYPKLAYMLHHQRGARPWSFSMLTSKKALKKSTRGYFSVVEGDSFLFFLNTTSEHVALSFKQAKLLHLNQLELEVQTIEIKDYTYFTYPEKEVKTVTIRLDTPTFFFDSRKKEFLEFTVETFLSYQLHKFFSLGLITEEYSADSLYPLLRLLRDDTSDGYLSLSRNNDKGVIDYHGKKGQLTFKLNGTEEEKALLWDLLFISQITGIGSRTSLGFGHNSIIKIG